MSIEERENYSQNDQYSQENETRVENEDYDKNPLDNAVSNEEQENTSRDFSQQGDYENKDDLNATDQEEDSAEMDDEDEDDFSTEDDDDDSESESDTDYTQSDINKGL